MALSIRVAATITGTSADTFSPVPCLTVINRNGGEKLDNNISLPVIAIPFYLTEKLNGSSTFIRSGEIYNKCSVIPPLNPRAFRLLCI